LIVLVLLPGLFLFVWNKNRGAILFSPDMIDQNVEQTDPSAVETGSSEALIFDEETVTFLRQYLKQRMRRNPLEQD
jgi:hypothetical protein